MYRWTTYGVCEVLETVWNQIKGLLAEGKHVSPYMVEFISVLERTLNYAHTGNTGCIATTLMNPLWVGMSLIEHGSPTFRDIVDLGTSGDGGRVGVPENLWPRHSITKMPLTASKRSQILTYGAIHWEVSYSASIGPFVVADQSLMYQTYLALLKMKFTSVTLPPHVFPDHPRPIRYCLAAADLAIRQFLVDTKVLVREGVQIAAKAVMDTGDDAAVEAANRRLEHMDEWLKTDFPLSYDEEPFVLLIRALHCTSNAPLALPISDDESMSTLELGQLLYNMGKADNPIQVRAPVNPKSPFLSVLRVAITYISDRTPINRRGEPSRFIVSILASVLDIHKVCHVPWSPRPPPNNTTGRPARRVVFDAWRSCNKTIESGERAIMQVLDQEEQNDISVQETARSAKRAHATTEWYIFGLTISDLASILHKQTAPGDWELSRATLSPKEEDSYIKQTYVWVRANYNGSKPIHCLAIIVAFMFSMVAPAMCHGTVPQVVATASRNSELITATVRSERWITLAEHTGVETSSRKGAKEARPIFVMMATTIIGLMEPQSPLRRDMEEHDGSFGKQWTKKHGEWFGYNNEGEKEILKSVQGTNTSTDSTWYDSG